MFANGDSLDDLLRASPSITCGIGQGSGLQISFLAPQSSLEFRSTLPFQSTSRFIRDPKMKFEDLTPVRRADISR
jgi:hypothetical protein